MTNKDRLYQLYLSARVGDGSYSKKQNGLALMSSDLAYLTFKRDLIISAGETAAAFRDNASGYNPNKHGYRFYARTNSLMETVRGMSVSEVLRDLNIFGLAIYYFDDGSYHKNKHFGHLYCNTFSDKEVDLLIGKFFELYPIKRCAKRLDRKKDGRQYPYIYIGTAVMREFAKDLQKIIKTYSLNSMLYKTGV